MWQLATSSSISQSFSFYYRICKANILQKVLIIIEPATFLWLKSLRLSFPSSHGVDKDEKFLPQGTAQRFRWRARCKNCKWSRPGEQYRFRQRQSHWWASNGRFNRLVSSLDLQFCTLLATLLSLNCSCQITESGSVHYDTFQTHYRPCKRVFGQNSRLLWIQALFLSCSFLSSRVCCLVFNCDVTRVLPLPDTAQAVDVAGRKSRKHSRIFGHFSQSRQIFECE